MRLRKFLILDVLFLLVLSLLAANAQTGTSTVAEAPLRPKIPSIDGMAGAALATSTDADALFGNPAGFTASKLTFTAISVGSWLTLRPVESAPGLWDLLAAGNFGLPGVAGKLTSEYSARGLGAGSSALIGISGKGVGLALSMVTDSYFAGTYPNNLEGSVQAELSIIAGLALKAHLLGLDVSIGADARPFARIHGVLDNADSASVLQQVVSGDVSLGVLDNVPTLNGYGLGVDAGIQARRGPFAFGLSVRDIGGTRINYALQDFQTVLDYVARGGFPPTSVGQLADVSGISYVVPMRIAAGVEYHPDLGSTSRFFDPHISLAVPDLLPVFGGTQSLLNALRLGARISLLSTLDLYAGLGVNYYSAGIGVKLLALDLSVAAYENTSSTGVAGDSGVTVRATLRF